MIIKRLKELWHSPRDMVEAEWYLLLAFFMMIWMWMVIKG